ncbi:hypothetical protein GCM10017691_19560 [Pseudonocardia petroleophila]|uniref:Uncharacterized protein n=1 Tax=Pseudonocardia petroleophila TaxID=37331 RepID=A0A7G7MGX1_9PSEU|nr:hypothetical protein [Pseudonocardia petroleophila]QNG52032.1 hypothetical protein H6H00_28840 [Pseudonocardia petroleophila]
MTGLRCPEPEKGRNVVKVSRAVFDPALCSRSRRVAVGLSCSLALAADLLTDEAPLHVLTLVAVTALVAATRLHLMGSSYGLMRALGACAASQPALHIAAEYGPHAQVEHGVGQQIGHADIAVMITQIVIATVIVGVVSFSDQIVSAVVGVIRVARTTSSFACTRASTAVVRRAPAASRLISRYRPGMVALRGPPPRFVA